MTRAEDLLCRGRLRLQRVREAITHGIIPEEMQDLALDLRWQYFPAERLAEIRRPLVYERPRWEGE